jgi:hypothetical protein
VTLQPGETKPFQATLSLVSRSGAVAGDPISISIGATSAVGGQLQRPIEWQLRGTVLPTIRLKPTTIDFGIVSNRVPPIESTVAVTSAANIERIQCESAANWMVDVSRKKNAPDTQFRVIVRSQGPLSPRQVADTIRVIPIDRQGKHLPEKTLTIKGNIVSDVVSTPPQLHCGRQPCGAVVDEVIQFRSLTERRFSVIGKNCDDSAIEIVRIGKETDRNPWTYSLRIHCDKAGPEEVVPDFEIQDEDGSRYKLVVPIRYQGIQHSDPAGASK